MSLRLPGALAVVTLLAIGLLNQPARASSDFVVFDDQLALGWQDWSWNTTVNFNNTTPARGSRSIAVTFNQGWAGLSLRAPSALDGASYEAITFWAHGGSSGTRQIQVYIQETDTGPASVQVPLDVQAGQWQAFTVPLQALGNPSQIKRINIQDRSGGAQPTFYIDDLYLRAGTTASLTATIHVSAHVTPLPISPYLLSSNLPAWLGETRLANPTFRARALASGLRLLRLPGGSWSNSYGWLSCQLRQNDPSRQPCGPGWESWAARPTDFIAFLKATHTEGMWVVNPLGTSKEAAALVAFFNGYITDTRSIGTDIRGTNWYTVGRWAGLRASYGYSEPIGIRYWEFGNEVYASKPSTGGSLCQSWGWEDTWTCDGFEYVNGKGTGSTRQEGYLEFRDAMRAVDSTIRLGAVGYEWPGTPSDGQSVWQTYAGWGARVISAAGDRLDFYAIHPYPFFHPPSLNQALSNPQHHLANIVSALDGAFQAYANGRRAPIAVTEFNLVSVSNQDTNQLMTRMVNALFLADSLGQAARLGIPIFAQWDLANGRDSSTGTEYGLMHEDNNYFRAPQYYVYPLWARFGSQMISATATLSPATQLSVYAGRVSSNTLSLIAINKTGLAITATIVTHGFGPISGGYAWEVRATGPMATSVTYNGSHNPSDALSEAPVIWSVTNAPYQYVFPPYSITLLHIHQGTLHRAWIPSLRR
ncbi:MAG: hypothetical protein RML99_06750 [Anaerolineae bacterium]|nr:hypothetical protein [Anaerolineae bacterium]